MLTHGQVAVETAFGMVGAPGAKVDDGPMALACAARCRVTGAGVALPAPLAIWTTPATIPRVSDQRPEAASTRADGATPVRSHTADPSVECPGCGYSLRGLTTARCPECGEPFDPRFLTVYQREADRGAVLGHRVGVVAVSSFIAIGTALAAASLLRDVDRFSAATIVSLLAVGGAAAGLSVLAITAFASGKVWPVRNDELRRRLFQAAALTVVLGASAALLGRYDLPLSERGPVIDTLLSAILFSLPGLALVLLTFISFYDRGAVEDRARRWLAEAPHGAVAAPFDVAAFGRWKYGQLTTEWVDTPRPSHPEIDRLIAATWDERVAEATGSGRLLYNGQMGRLIAARADRERLHLVIGPTCYRDFVGTNLFNADAVRAVGESYLANPAGISSTAITSDGYVLYGRRNDKVAYHPGYLHTFGGALEEPDRQEGGGYDPFLAAIRELCEELIIEPEEVANIVCLGIVRDTSLRQPEIIFDATLNLTRVDVLARFDPAGQHQEHSAMEWLFDTPDEVLPFLERGGLIAPILEGALLLHGRANWGEDWYEQACMVRYGGLPADGQSPVETGATRAVPGGATPSRR